MDKKIRTDLIKIAETKQVKDDPSHDFQHILRVLSLAEAIGQKERADMDVLVPAALFHDIVVYPKNSPKSKNESDESAAVARQILSKVKGYPSSKIPRVEEAIRQCSFEKKIIPESLESRILQDADGLEATGAISIMRTFSSGGQMNRPFYDPKDPFCKDGSVAFRSGLDLFYRRLLIIRERMHTRYARKLALRRTKFLRAFLAEFKTELKESGVYQ
jgi:uncharacterized protein